MNANSVRFDSVRWKLFKRIKKIIVSNIESIRNRRTTTNDDRLRRRRFRRSIVQRARCCRIVRRRSCVVCANTAAILCEECACISNFISRTTSHVPTTTSSSRRRRWRTVHRRLRPSLRLRSYSNVQFVRRCLIMRKRWSTIWNVFIRRKVCANVPNVIRGFPRNGI